LAIWVLINLSLSIILTLIDRSFIVILSNYFVYLYELFEIIPAIV